MCQGFYNVTRYNMKMTQTELLDKLSKLCDELGGGTYETYITYDSKGTTCKKIVIEYDIKDKSE